MSKYQELLQKPVQNNIVGTPKKVLIDLISCMCDNHYQLTFELNENGTYSVLTHGQAFSNHQMNCTKADLIWEAEDKNWNRVVEMINSGVVKISQIRIKN